MNDERNVLKEQAAPAAGQPGLVDILIVMARHKKLILGLPLAAALAAAAISLALPNVYRASTKMLPPQQAQSGASALLAQLGGLAGAMPGMKNPSDMYIGMLKSRTVADRLVARYELKKVYQSETQELARVGLAGNTLITAGKDGMITVEVDSKDPGLAAGLANGYVEELQRLTKVLAVTEASQRRLFFERQLELTKDNLAKSEAALKQSMNRSGVVSVDAESRAVLETAARLRAQVSAKEIQLGAMKAFVTASHPTYRQAEEELSSLRAELSRLENGRAGATAEEGAAGKSGGVESIQLLRDVKYYQMLYEMLAKQYELARLDEAKEPTLIQVLDPAVVPEHKFKPRRAIIVVVTGVLFGFVALACAFALEARRKARQSAANSARWNELKAHLRFR